jgi:predicted nucleotidyltransferase
MNQSLKTDRNSYLIQTRLGISQQKLEEICTDWKITELALFGSILRGHLTFVKISPRQSAIEVGTAQK